VDWQMHVYGGTAHSFTNTEAAKRGRPDAIRYNASADARSWTAMLALLGETLGTPTGP
jgi:dienelactone hydrolase